MALDARKLFLASGSPRRKEILKTFSIPFTVIPNGLTVEPKISSILPLSKQLKQLTIQKAISSQRNHKGLILSADTLVYFEGNVLGKPRNLEEAKKTLSILSNNTHSVFTGICLLDTITGKKKTRIIESKVTFKPLTSEQISHYCDTYKPLDKAGSYGIQELPDGFVAYVNGCQYNVMGLPIKTVLQLLKVYDIV